MTIYLLIGSAVGLALFGYFVHEVCRDRTFDVVPSLVVGAVFGALSVMLWPVTLFVLSCMVAAGRRAGSPPQTAHYLPEGASGGTPAA